MLRITSYLQAVLRPNPEGKCLNVLATWPKKVKLKYVISMVSPRMDESVQEALWSLQ